MALLEKKVTVKKSGLSNAGNGLFAKDFIPKNMLIVEYKGKITNWKDVDDNDGNNGYIYYVKRDHVIDASKHTKALARYANDARGLRRTKGLINNAEYVEIGTKVFIKSNKDIAAGTEIFVEYGKEYWDVIKHNQKVEKERQKKLQGALRKSK
ncbi:SET domain-containing protein-lysine N-methyltransferase [Chitinophagaceae bacterium IBVUCB2]|nr:SET domain-containing protein-lysine N-methyltransferase [Chitinophagaceae bacterium IBVUCB2]